MFYPALLRGYREKWLHKNLQKNKDSICRALRPEKLAQPALVQSILDESVCQRVEKEEKEDEKMEEEENDEEKDEEKEGDKSNVTSENREAERDEQLNGEEEKEEEKMDTAPVEKADESDNASSCPLVADMPVGGVWDPEFPHEAVAAARHVLDNLKAIKQRLFDAHLQLKVCVCVCDSVYV